MDFVPSSQPFEDGEDLLECTPGNPLDLLHHPRHPWLPPDNLNADDFVDFVGTSQPFDDGEEDWSVLMTPPARRTQSLHVPAPLSRAESPPSDTSHLDPDIHARRARLIRRASPVLYYCRNPAEHRSLRRPPFSVASILLDVSQPALRNRCAHDYPSMSAVDLERKRQQAADKARDIAKKIRALAAKTASLRKKHRQLCAFAGGSAGKENARP
ncbi:hypothetical protein FB451DRAFT_1296124 [Mycena latifolia]|nr:hypothetical protein FB451DRAFT_1296124 [Mycena latifolia]